MQHACYRQFESLCVAPQHSQQAVNHAPREIRLTWPSFSAALPAVQARAPELQSARTALQRAALGRLRELQLLAEWPLMRPRRTPQQMERLLAGGGDDRGGLPVSTIATAHARGVGTRVETQAMNNLLLINRHPFALAGDDACARTLCSFQAPRT